MEWVRLAPAAATAASPPGASAPMLGSPLSATYTGEWWKGSVCRAPRSERLLARRPLCAGSCTAPARSPLPLGPSLSLQTAGGRGHTDVHLCNAARGALRGLFCTWAATRLGRLYVPLQPGHLTPRWCVKRVSVRWARVRAGRERETGVQCPFY